MKLHALLGEAIELGVALAAARTAPRAKAARLGGIFALCGLIAILMAIALGCAVASLWIWLLPRCGAAGAPLTVAACLVAASSLIYILLWRRARFAKLRSAAQAAQEKAQFSAEALRIFQENKLAALMTVFLAGIAAASDRR